TRTLSGPDAQLALHERVGQLAGHETEAGPCAEPGVSRDRQWPEARLRKIADGGGQKRKTDCSRRHHDDEAAECLVLAEDAHSAERDGAIDWKGKATG